jgi:hypothetical protein
MASARPTLRGDVRTEDLTAVQWAVDRLLAGELEPMLKLLAADLKFEVVYAGDAPGRRTSWGKRPVAEYFTALGGLMAFWQIDYTAAGGQIIAWGKERFVVERSGLEGGCDFALVFELSGGTITRFLVIEDASTHPVSETPARCSRFTSATSKVLAPGDWSVAP